MRFHLLIAICALGLGAGCGVGGEDLGPTDAELEDLPYSFTGAVANAFRYSDGSWAGAAQVGGGDLQAAAFEAGRAACGGLGGDGYASIGWYQDGFFVHHQQYHCGDL